MLKPLFVRPRTPLVLDVGNERPETPASHLEAIDTIGMVWRTNGAANVWVVGQFQADREIDFAAVISANAIPATKWRLRLANSIASLTGAPAYDSGAVDFISPAITREDGLYHSFHQMPSAVTRNHYRIDITGHTGDFEASTIILGKQVQSSCFANPEWQHEAEDLGDIEVGRFGVPSVTDGLIFRRLAFTLGWTSFAKYEEEFRPLIENRGVRKPIYVCFDPEATTRRQANTFLGWFRKSPVARGGKLFDKYTQDFEIFSMI